jgi:hypothetical protein
MQAQFSPNFLWYHFYSAQQIHLRQGLRRDSNPITPLSDLAMSAQQYEPRDGGTFLYKIYPAALKISMTVVSAT